MLAVNVSWVSCIMYAEIRVERGETMPQEGYPNLIGPGDRTPDERRESARNAGKASGVSRNKRKTFRESLLTILSMPVDDPETYEALKKLGLDGTFQSAIDLAQIRNAQRGDTDASRFVRDTIGEKPREGIEIGNLDDRPLATIDMSKLTDDQLRQLAAQRAESGD